MPTVKLTLWGTCSTEIPDHPLSLVIRRALSNLGYEIVGVKDKISCPNLIVEPGDFWSFLKLLFRSGRKIVVSLEPPVTNSFGHSMLLRRMASRVVVLSEHLRAVDTDLVHWLGSDLYDLTKPIITESGNRSPTIALVNSNKISFIQGEMYSSRRSAVTILTSAGFKVRLAGHGWGISKVELWKRAFKQLLWDLLSFGRLKFNISNFQKIPSHSNLELVGPVDDPTEFLSTSSFALVIENDTRYISEKIFQAVCAGSLPLYVGPDLESIGLPTKLAFPTSLDSLIEDMSLLIENPVIQTRILEAGRRWLLGEECLDFSLENTWNGLILKLNEVGEFDYPSSN